MSENTERLNLFDYMYQNKFEFCSPKVERWPTEKHKLRCLKGRTDKKLCYRKCNSEPKREKTFNIMGKQKALYCRCSRTSAATTQECMSPIQQPEGIDGCEYAPPKVYEDNQSAIA